MTTNVVSNITPKSEQYIYMIALYLVAIISMMYIFLLLMSNCKSQLRNIVDSQSQKCFLKCSGQSCNLTKYQGVNYLHGTMVEENKCIFSIWSLTHFILYAFIGFFCPDCFIESFLIGVSFEIFEYMISSCHDPLDILWNTLGFAAGAMIREYLY